MDGAARARRARRCSPSRKRLRQAYAGGGIPHHRRGRSGHPELRRHEKTGGVVGIKVVDGSEDLLLVTKNGILIRTPADNIRVAGRSTQGVIVMRFKEEGDQVISMALAEHEDTEDVSAEAEVSTEISANEENPTAET